MTPDAPTDSPHPVGPDRRRGPFRAGERVQLTDVKGRLHTVLLTHDGYFQSQRGSFHHRELIGQPEGTVVTTASGHDVLALRPVLADYVMSMPRGAAVVYPKDAGQIVQMGDIYPGARVVEAGVGSGALTMSLLSAVGEHGSLHSVERRAEFAEIAEANVESWFGGRPPTWTVTVGDLADVLDSHEPGTVDRVVLDMLAPWENVRPAARAMAPGGVLIAYVATTTQLSRVVEELRGSERFTEPQPWEAVVRGWHVEGLAVRPDHRMVAHTGFLVTARTLAPGSRPPQRTRRPAKGAGPLGVGAHGTGPVGAAAAEDTSTPEVAPGTSVPTPEVAPGTSVPTPEVAPGTSVPTPEIAPGTSVPTSEASLDRSAATAEPGPASTSRHAPPVGVDSGSEAGAEDGWTGALSANERTISVKKLRRVGRDVRRRAEIEATGWASRPASDDAGSAPGRPGPDGTAAGAAAPTGDTDPMVEG